MSGSTWLADWQARAGKRWWWPLLGAPLVIVAILIWAAALAGSGPNAPAAAPPPPAGEERATAAALPAPPDPAPAPAPGSTPASAPAQVQQDAGGALSPTVKIVFRTFPGRRAVVMWGGKRLGFIDRNAPLVVERPRDSGPVDVVIRATGYVPVHTRAYTFNDSNIDVKITQLDKKDTIYGYKQPLPPDAGVPLLPGEAAELPE